MELVVEKIVLLHKELVKEVPQILQIDLVQKEKALESHIQSQQVMENQEVMEIQIQNQLKIVKQMALMKIKVNLQV